MVKVDKVKDKQQLSVFSSHTNSLRGFTIVELLIVIVVIGILAAITIIAYNGIQAKAVAASVQSDLETSNKQLIAYLTTSSTGYPSAIDCSATPAANTICLKSSGTTTYQYSVNNASLNSPTYCLTATSGTTSYFIGGTASNPTPGGCPGHGIGGTGPVTNMDTNPSVETSISGYTPNNAASSIALSTTRAYAGTTSIMSTSLNNSYNYSGWKALAPVVAGTTYTLSCWIYLPAAYGVSGVAATVNGAGLGVIHGNFVTAIGVWTRSSIVFTPTTSASINIYAITNSVATPPVNATFFSDAVMVTQGSTLYTYADGDSTNWLWTGTPELSTSFGPAL